MLPVPQYACVSNVKRPPTPRNTSSGRYRDESRGVPGADA